MAICYRRTNNSGTPTNQNSSSSDSHSHSHAHTGEVVKIAHLADCRLSKVRDSATTFIISSPSRTKSKHRSRGASSRSQSQSHSHATGNGTRYVLHAEDSSDRDRWLQALSSLQSVVVEGTLLAGRNPLADGTSSFENTKQNHNNHNHRHSDVVEGFEPLGTWQRWAQQLEEARAKHLDALTHTEALREAMENLTVIEDTVARCRFVEPVGKSPLYNINIHVHMHSVWSTNLPLTVAWHLFTFFLCLVFVVASTQLHCSNNCWASSAAKLRCVESWRRNYKEDRPRPQDPVTN